MDPEVRNGTQGPEGGGEVNVGEDVWICGNVCVLPGVTIGKGATIGAGSVVTKVSEVLPLSDKIESHGRANAQYSRMWPPTRLQLATRRGISRMCLATLTQK